MRDQCVLVVAHLHRSRSRPHGLRVAGAAATGFIRDRESEKLEGLDVPSMRYCMSPTKCSLWELPGRLSLGLLAGKMPRKIGAE